MFLFVALMWVHAFEALYAACLCKSNGFTTSLTVGWMFRVFVSGAFALVRIPTPAPAMESTSQNGEPKKCLTHNGD